MRDRPGDLFAIGHLRRADIGVDLVGALEDVDLDVEMQFAHPLQDGLTAFLIGRHAEGRILVRELRQRDAELFLVGLRLRLDRDLDHRLGEFHLFENDLLVGIAQRIAGAGLLQAGLIIIYHTRIHPLYFSFHLQIASIVSTLDGWYVGRAFS